MAFSAIGGAGAVAGLGGALISSRASKKAANTQANSAALASMVQQQALENLRRDLAPYREIGNQALGSFGWLLNLGGDPRNSPLGEGAEVYSNPLQYRTFQPTMAELEATPGYQFTRDQGLKAVNNSMSARGLIGSGAQGKGLADYATGLASTTYQQQLENYMRQFGLDLSSRMEQSQLAFNQKTANQQNLYNRLLGISGMGQSAAAMAGQGSLQTGQMVGGNLIGAGNAQASGTVGSANALTGGLNNAAASIQQALLLSKLLGNTTSGFNNPIAGGGGSGATDPSTIPRR